MKGRVIQVQVPNVKPNVRIRVNARTVDEILSNLPRLAVRAD